MNKKITSIIIFIGLFCLVSFALAQVTIENPLKAGGVNDFPTLLGKILTGVTDIVATLSVIMLTIAGILYLTSAGSPEKINVAKKALGYAIIGIVIALAATAIKDTILLIIGATASPP